MLWIELPVCHVRIATDRKKYINNSNVCENRLSASSRVSVRPSVRMEGLGYRRTKFREM